MFDAHRLYALSSTHTHPWLSGDGPSLLINDPVLALRWYLTHEREEGYEVTVRASADGRSWQPLAVHELAADAERALVTGGPAESALAREALAAEAAEWLDARIRFVQGDDPTPSWPDRPDEEAWRLGGQIWALVMGTVPHEEVLTRLTAQYTDPQPEGPGLLREAARQLLDALELAEAPDGGPPGGDGELAAAAGLLDRLGYVSQIGQLRGPLEQARHQLDGRRAALEPTVGAGRAPAGPDPSEGLSAGQDDGPALPGFPSQFTDLEAAAAWRVISPVARRTAEWAMDDLVRQETWLLQASAEAADWEGGRPRDPDRAAAFDRLNWVRQQWERRQAVDRVPAARESLQHFRERLQKLDAAHAVLMHAAVLDDAEQAAKRALHAAAIEASQASLLSPAARQYAQPDGSAAEHDAFFTHYTAAEARINEVMDEQRQLTRDALHRLFPKVTGGMSMFRLHTRLVDRAGLGTDAVLETSRALDRLRRERDELQTRFTSPHHDFGPPVTEEDVREATERVDRVEQRYADLRSSRADTLRAAKALARVAGMAPTAREGWAARAEQIAAQSRDRAQILAPAGARPSSRAAAQQHQAPHHTAPHTGPVTKPA